MFAEDLEQMIGDYGRGSDEALRLSSWRYAGVGMMRWMYPVTRSVQYVEGESGGRREQTLRLEWWHC